MNKKYTILIIDDKVENLQYLTKVLDIYYDIRPTTDANFAIKAAKQFLPDLILLDIMMPDIDGFEVCKLFKNDEQLNDIPIIFISAMDEIEQKVKAFDSGGIDYITKPFQPQEVISRVKIQLELSQNKKTIEKLLEQQDIFIKKIMHEMNTPMSIISLNSETLERNIGPKKEFDSIRASVKTLSSIYGDLSYMVKKESREYKTKKINIIDFISSRIIFFDEMLTIKNIDIDFDFNEEFNININEYEFERIIDNTLSNSIKYSNENSLITIFAGKENNEYVLSIKDEGIGIDENIDIFEAYYQQSSNNVGLGLGLTIVKEICDKYNINIEVESQKEKGTRFIYNFTNIKQDKL